MCGREVRGLGDREEHGIGPEHGDVGEFAGVVDVVAVQHEPEAPSVVAGFALHSATTTAFSSYSPSACR
jgi:hypothetical protein